MELNKIENEGKWSDQTTRLNSNFNKINQETESLKSTYRALTQSDVLVVSTLPAEGKTNTIYRVVGNGSYSDYMYNSDDLTTPILMATYNNAIDLYPQEGSENLITSGAVYESYANQVYLDDQGQASIPDFTPQSDSVWSHGVQEISAVNQKQVRANLGFGDGDIDDVPTAGSSNLVKSGGVADSINRCTNNVLNLASFSNNEEVNILTLIEWESGSLYPDGRESESANMVRSKTRFAIDSSIKIVVNSGYEILYNNGVSTVVLNKSRIVLLSGEYRFMLRRVDQSPISPDTIIPSDFGSVSADSRMKKDVLVIDYVDNYNTAITIFDCLSYSNAKKKLFRNLSTNEYHYYEEQPLSSNKIYLIDGQRYIYNGIELVYENKETDDNIRNIDGKTEYTTIWVSKNRNSSAVLSFGEAHIGDKYKVSIKSDSPLSQTSLNCGFSDANDNSTIVATAIQFKDADVSEGLMSETEVIINNETSCLKLWMIDGVENVNVSVNVTKIEIASSIPSIENDLEKIMPKLSPLNIAWEDGGFNGSGNNADVAYSMKRSVDKLHCSDGHQLFVGIKNGYEVVLWDGTQNYVLYNHFSVGTASLRLGIRRTDRAEISEPISEIIKVNEFVPSNDSYTIKLAASDSADIYKRKADIVCDGVNDQYYIQCSIANHDIPTKVLLYPGHYYITEVRDCPPNNSGLYGHKVVFTSPSEHGDTFARVINVQGLIRSAVQREMNFESCIQFTQDCWNSISDNGEQVSVISHEDRGTLPGTLRNSFMQLENISIRGLDRHKPVCFVDGYYSSNMQISKVNVKSGTTEETFSDFTYIPNEQNIGFRGTQGSPYGTNFIKNCLAWNVGIGYSIGGEHFVLEDCAGCFSKLAFAFSCYDGSPKMEHNNIMIKCVCSQCMESIRFGRYGIPEDVDESQLSEAELAKLHSFQDIECYGLQFGENVFTTSGLDGYEDGAHPTLGFYEVHPDTWRGIITTQGFRPIGKGCKQLKVTNLNLKVRGVAADKPYSNVTPEFSTYYDETNNIMWTLLNGSWIPQQITTN